jgi:hypothetical protein
VESNETAILTVTSGTGYNVASPSVATGTITNDDTDVTLVISPSSVLEDGATNLVYTFTRVGVTGSDLTVNFAVSGNPNGKSLPAWPEFKGANGKSMILGDKVEAGEPLDAQRIALYDFAFGRMMSPRTSGN